MGTARFLSKKLDSAQVNYSAFDRELLAAFSAVQHFRFQVEGRPFQLWTDHAPSPSRWAASPTPGHPDSKDNSAT